MKKAKLVTLMISFCLAAIMAALLVGCAAPASTPVPAPASSSAAAPAPKAAPITLKGLSAYPQQAPSSHGLQTFRDLVNQRSNGALVINWAGGPEIIGSFDQPQAVSVGSY